MDKDLAQIAKQEARKVEMKAKSDAKIAEKNEKAAIKQAKKDGTYVPPTPEEIAAKKAAKQKAKLEAKQKAKDIKKGIRPDSKKDDEIKTADNQQVIVDDIADVDQYVDSGHDQTNEEVTFITSNQQIEQQVEKIDEHFFDLENNQDDEIQNKNDNNGTV